MGKVSAGLPAGPAQRCLASTRPAALPPRAALATSVKDFP